MNHYSKWFDEFSSRWKPNQEDNLMFLRLQQDEANRLLDKRGHLFLNEVYDLLDIPRTQEGTMVGWIKADNTYVTFGLFNLDQESANNLVSESKVNILLDFNVDGIIWNLI